MDFSIADDLGRRLQFTNFNQPIGFWIGVGIGGVALLSLLLFSMWYACCFDRDSTLVLPDGGVGGGDGGDGGGGDDDEEAGGGGDDGEAGGGDDEEEAGGEDGEDGGGGGEDGEDGGGGGGGGGSGNGGGGGGSGGGGKRKKRPKMKAPENMEWKWTLVPIDEHTPLFQRAARKAGLGGWTFSSLKR